MNQTGPASGSARDPSPRILVDTYNLALRNGSGIKTYGITLLEAYRRLGYAVDVLTANADVTGRSPLLDDPVAKITPRVTVANPGDFLSQSKGTLYQKVANVPDIFHAANRLFAVTGQPVRLKLPSPMDVWHRTTLLPVHVEGIKSITTIFATLDDKKMFHRLRPGGAVSGARG